MIRIFIDSSVLFSAAFSVSGGSRELILMAVREEVRLVVAAAKKAKVDLLVTLDRKHLLDKPEVAVHAGMPVVTPQDVLAYIRKTN